MSETELAWAAGFFDGEGCIYAAKVVNRAWRKPGLSIAQTDPGPLHRWCRAVGLDESRVYGPRAQGGLGRKPVWDVRVSSISQTHEIMALLWPYLCEPKRQQAERVFALEAEGKQLALIWRASRPNNARGGRFGAPRDASGRFLPKPPSQ